MRSRSSLMSHVLGSNPAIAGYYEQHLSHRRSDIVAKLRMRMGSEGLISSSTKFLYDKTLHTHLDPALNDGSVKIFMLRSPFGAVASTIKMGEKRNTMWQDEVLSLTYYCYRLRELQLHSEQLEQPFAYLDSDALLTSTESSLERLSTFLNLETPLAADYKSFDRTGEPGSGDPSGALNAGRIISDRSKQKDWAFENPELLAEAQKIYETTSESLKAHSKAVLI